MGEEGKKRIGASSAPPQITFISSHALKICAIYVCDCNTSNHTVAVVYRGKDISLLRDHVDTVSQRQM